MSMNFLDDTDDWPEYQAVRDEIQRLDKEVLGIKEELEAAESALNADFANEALKIKVEWLKKKLKEIEQRLDDSLSMYR